MSIRPLVDLHAGDKLRLTAGNKQVEAILYLGSPNGISLMVGFDDFVYNYLGMMPLIWSDEECSYVDLIQSRRVVVEKLPDNTPV